MKGIIREIVIPISALVDRSITPGTKLLLWTIAYLTNEKYEWVVDSTYIQDTLGIEPNNLSHKLIDLEKTGWIKKQIKYEGKTTRYTVVSLTKKFRDLIHWNNGQEEESELKKLNHSKTDNPVLDTGDDSELKKLNRIPENSEEIYRLDENGQPIIPVKPKEVIEEKTIVTKDNSNTLDITLDSEKEIKINSQTFHKEKGKVVAGRLFTTMHSDKKDLNSQKKAVIAQMFAYADMEFQKNDISVEIVNLFKTFMREMLLCRRVTGEDAKAMVAQIIKFKKILGYHDDEIIECLQESLMRRWMYIKPIDNLAEYRMKKAAAEDSQKYNNSEHESGRKVNF